MTVALFHRGDITKSNSQKRISIAYPSFAVHEKLYLCAFICYFVDRNTTSGLTDGEYLICQIDYTWNLCRYAVRRADHRILSGVLPMILEILTLVLCIILGYILTIQRSRDIMIKNN